MSRTAVRFSFVLSAPLALLALLAAAAPVFAGQVFIPVIGHHSSDGRIAYRTEVWVSNPGQAGAQAVVRFLEQGSDRAALPEGSAVVMVPAGATVLLAKVAPNGEGGMLEVSAAAGLEVRAHLVAISAVETVSAVGAIPPAGASAAAGTGAVAGGIEVIDGPDAIAALAASEAADRTGELSSTSAAMPAVSAAGALVAGEVAHLQGLRRQPGGEVTDLGLLNLSTQAAQCQVSAFRSDGSQIAPAAGITLPPLGMRELPDAFGALGDQRLSGGRFEVSCDQRFYAYAAVFAAGGQVIEAAAPSQGVADVLVTGAPATPGTPSAPSTAPAPSSAVAAIAGAGAGLDSATETSAAAVPERTTSASGVVTLVVPGTFLHATATNSFISYDLAARPGLGYRRATVDFDLTIKNFNPVLLFTGVTSLRRPNKHRKDRVLYYAMQLVNRNQKTVLDLGVQDRIARTQGPWQAGHTYHLTFTYDLRGRQVKLDLFEHGQHIYQISGPALHFDLSANANPLTVDFGQTGIGDGAYGPPIGWTYANLNVQLQP